MKALNDTHKKWILTASLASLLSLNLVMSLHGNTTTYSAEFASSTPMEIETSKGVVKLKIRASADGKQAEVDAVSDGASTTTICKSCTYTINQEYNLENIGLIAAAVKREIENPKNPVATTQNASAEVTHVATARPKAATAAAAPAEPEEDDEDGLEEDESDAKLAALEKSCKKHTEQSRRMQCLGNGLAKLLDADSTISEDAAIEVWQSRIRKGMIDGLINPITHARSQKVMEKLFKNVDREKYGQLRQEVLLAATQAVIERYKDAQDFANDERYAPGAQPAYIAKLREADSLRNSLRQFTDETLTDRQDLKMKRVGYRLPTEEIHQKLSQYRPYKELSDINGDIYEAGTGYAVLPLSAPPTLNADGTTSTAGNGTGLRRAAPQVLQQHGITTRQNNVNPNSVSTGAVIGTGGNIGGGEIRKRGAPNGAQQMQQAQPGRAAIGLPQPPGAGMVPPRSY